MIEVVATLGFGASLAAFVLSVRSRRPDVRRKKLRARCAEYLNGVRHTRRAFQKIVREAVDLYTPSRVAIAAGVPIDLIFDWNDGNFGKPPEEIYSRSSTVASILWLVPLGPHAPEKCRQCGFPVTGKNEIGVAPGLWKPCPTCQTRKAG